MKQPDNGRITEYLRKNTSGSKAVRNTVNFLIRNTMTGIAKDPQERTENERSVLERVEKAVRGYNEARLARFLSGNKSENASPPKPVKPPSPGHWMLTYGLVDYLLKSERNEAYYSCTSQVNQKAIRKTIQAWKSYFKSLKAWKKDPSKFREKPNIPGYIRGNETTAHFTNQACSYSVVDGKAYLKFYGLETLVCVGNASTDKLVKAEAVPKHGHVYLHLTFEDSLEEPEVPESPLRIMGIDTGVKNFLAVSTNTGLPPFLVDGAWLKSVNQWYNKAKGKAVARLTAGHDPKDKGVRRESRYTQKLSDDRYNTFRDWFYRIGHFLFRYAAENKVQVIVIGHNEGQKDGVAIGHRNNQEFVSIPYSLFISTMGWLSRIYQIPVVVTEESYTSKASVLDNDELPVYAGETGGTYTFSGKRVKRGLYKSSDGTLLNADVNGSANIIRKVYPYAFAGMDLTYLTRGVKRVTVQEILDKRRRFLTAGEAKGRRLVHKRYSRKSKGSVKRGHEKRCRRLRHMQEHGITSCSSLPGTKQVTPAKRGTGSAGVRSGVA